MWDDAEIAAVQRTLRHAADHLAEIKDEVNEPYHEGRTAPDAVLGKLCPMLNTIEHHARQLRDALAIMAKGGLKDDGRGGWHWGTHGPYDTLDEALAVSDVEDIEFVVQTPEENDVR